jgi:hypothetical protein
MQTRGVKMCEDAATYEELAQGLERHACDLDVLRPGK